jgi:hypothetical protein
MAKTIWGVAFSWAYASVIGTVEVAAATVDAAVNGKSLEKTIDEWTENLHDEMDKAGEFGDNNAKDLNQLASTVLGPVVDGQISKRS